MPNRSASCAVRAAPNGAAQARWVACPDVPSLALLEAEFVVSVERVMVSNPAAENTDPPPQSEVAPFLVAEGADPAAIEASFPLLYEELRAIARKQRRAWQGNGTLNTTALLHEAYLKMANQQNTQIATREHFFAIAATAMRHILCTYARDQNRKKRGGGAYRVSASLLEHIAAPDGLSDDAADRLSDLGDALNRLALINKRYTQVVECRFFAGLSVEETAAALDLSPATVKRDWSFARAWLLREMQHAG